MASLSGNVRNLRNILQQIWLHKDGKKIITDMRSLGFSEPVGQPTLDWMNLNTWTDSNTEKVNLWLVINMGINTGTYIPQTVGSPLTTKAGKNEHGVHVMHSVSL